MKKNILLTLAIAFLLMSCNEILDLNPTDKLSTGTFWKTKADADMALAGVYNSTYKCISGADQSQWMSYSLFDALTDNCSLWNNRDNLNGVVEGPVPTTPGIIVDLYQSGYAGIARANDFLSNVEGISDASLTEAVKAQYVAEAKFIRVYWYYWLTQCYSDIPYVDHPLTVETMRMPVTKKADIVTKLLADLDECIANLPDKSYSSNNGHAVKGSAQALKARIQLFNGDYAGAVATTEAIIAGGKFSLNTVGSTAYGDIFTGDVNQSANPEIMFSSKYYYPGLYHWQFVLLNWFGDYIPQPEFAYGWQTGDNRQHQCMAYPGDKWITQSGVVGTPPFLTVTVVGTHLQLPLVLNKFNAYSKRSWTGGDAGTEATEIPHFRYAEVLLMHAEALSQSKGGPTQAAYDDINKVRNRASLPNLTTGLTQEQFLDSILRERRYEFVAEEAIRFMDLRRYKLCGKILPNVPYPHLNADKATDAIPTVTASTPKMKWDDRWYIWPIPQSEVDKDPDNLAQVNKDRGY